MYSFGFNQRNFNGTRPVTNAAINLGATRGKGSSSRMFNYCKQNSLNPSLCINQFIRIVPNNKVPDEIDYLNELFSKQYDEFIDSFERLLLKYNI